MDALAKIESGERSPRLGTVVLLAKALGVSTAELFGELPPEHSPAITRIVVLLRDEDEHVQEAALEIVRLFVETPRRRRHL